MARCPPKPLQYHARQRGAAIVTALLVVTLAVVIVSGMLWRQQVEIRAVENQRLKAQALAGRPPDVAARSLTEVLWWAQEELNL